MSSTINACHVWDGGGITLSSSVDFTCISKQYWVSGWLGVGFLAREWDGKRDGALPNSSGFSWPFWPFVSVRVWPLVWILISGSKSCRLLHLAAIDMKTVVVNWNSGYVHTDWVQKPLQEIKVTNGLAVTASYPWWVGDPLIHHQQIPSQMRGTLPTREKVLTSHLEPPEWQFKGWSWTTTAPHHQTRPLGSCHFFLSPPRDARKYDLSGGTLDGLMGSPKWWFIPCVPILTKRLWSLPLWYQVWVDPGGWATWLAHKQLK